MSQAPDAPSAEDAGPETITITIKSTSSKFTLSVPLSITVLDLKTKISTPEYADVSPSTQRLIYSGRVLKDGETLESYKVKDGNTVHLVKSAPSNQRQNPETSSTSASSTSGAVPRPAAVPSNIAAGTGNNPLAGLTGARYAGFAQLPGAGMFGPDGGMGPPPSSDQMIEMLSNPAVAQQFNEALQNPAIIDMMIQQSPQLREMGPAARQMLQSEEFRRMMTDPERLRAMQRLQTLMGGGGAGGGQDAFPMPGVTDTTPAENRGPGDTPAATTTANAPPAGTPATGVAPPANPFAQLFGMPPPGGNQANTGGVPQNPFASLFGPNPSAPPTGQTDTNTQAATDPNAMFQNPEILQQALRAMGGGNNAQNEALANMLGAGGNPFAAPADTRPPEQRFETQLRQLNEMGFFDYDRNIQALQRSGGDVNGALEFLFSQT